MVNRIHSSFIPTPLYKNGLLVLLVLTLFSIQSAIYPGFGSMAFPNRENQTPSSLPLLFVAGNLNDQDGSQYFAMGVKGTLSFKTNTLELSLPGTDPFQIQFLGANNSALLQPSHQQGSIVNRYSGTDPSTWQVNMPTYSALTYSDLYPGIDLLYEGLDGQLKGTYILRPGANPNNIHWQYDGVQKLWLDSTTEDLLVQVTDQSILREHAPIAWQVIQGVRQPIRVQFILHGNEVFFKVGAYNTNHELIIDPTISYGTYLGAGSTDAINGLDVDNQGNIVVVGQTYSSNFPGSTGSRKGTTDIFITKINAQGNSIIFTTILGGNDDDDSFGVSLDSDGNIWLAGETQSEDFPLINPIHPAEFDTGYAKAYAARLSSTGIVQMSTMIGLEGNNTGRAVDIDPQGNAYITGETSASYGPQAFVTKFSASGDQQVYLWKFGAAERGFDKGSTAASIAVDSEGFAYITGRTNSIVFPVMNPYQATCRESDDYDCTGSDAFIVKVNQAGNGITYGTYLGGSSAGSEWGTGSDEGKAIAVDSEGYIYVAGVTFSPDFPVVNAFQSAPGGMDNFADGFLVKLTPQGNTIVYSTYLGGEAWEELLGLAVDSNGKVYVAGFTSSNNYPVSADAIQPNTASVVCIVGSTERYCYEGVLTAFNANGTLATSTYLGGDNDDIVSGIALHGSAIYMAGKTESYDLPTTAGSLQFNKALNDDGFIFKIETGNVVPPPPGDFRVYLPNIRIH